jgi:methylenetetrahydrofolate dehydrogenase (NADP+)/methenyltetrahydrofolate cyclohydrolase
LPIEADDAALAAALAALNADETVNGILLQFPLPPHLSAVQAATLLAPAKDVDGVNPLNAGRLYLGQGEFLAPATPLGGIELLRLAGIPLAGRSVVVVGRSAIVGRPLAMLCLQRDATVTISHSRTPDLAGVTRQADVLAVAVGRPGLITAEMVRPGAVVLDFGTTVVDGRLVGDVSPDVAAVAGALTPVPGGTGPMTSAMLIQNTLLAAERQGRFTP